MDPMYGSGSTFRALMGLGTTKFFGWELDKDKAGRAQLKSLAHAHSLLNVKGFSLTHYDEVVRLSEFVHQPGERIRWKDQNGDVHEGTIVEVDPQYERLDVRADDPNFGWNRRQHPDGPPPDYTVAVPLRQVLT